LRRNPARELDEAGIRTLLADITDPSSLKSLPNRFDWVVNTVSAARGGATEYERTYVLGTANVMEWLGNTPPRRYVYTSSTSVYGQDDGSEVSELSATCPAAATSQALLRAESLLRESRRAGKLDSVVLRCAGIYGPGRGYWLQQFLAGQAVMEGSGERWLNMTHRDDVAGAVRTVLKAKQVEEVYNVVDDEPVKQRDVFEWLAHRLKRPLPPGIPAETAIRQRGATNKRVSNRKLRLDLHWELEYPSFRAGYEAELARLGVS
jgi:nucleoside-diphosphate-sugar epimerase